MKTIYTLCAVIGMPLLACAQASPSTVSNPENAQWISGARAAIEQRQYRFEPLGNGVFAAANPAQKAGFRISARGYEVRPVQQGADTGWSCTFTVASLNGQELPASKNCLTEGGTRRIAYSNGALTTEYLHNSNGLRQNFIVSRKQSPGCLALELAVGGNLKPEAVNNEVSFTDAAGKTRLRYDDLRVWDAGGRRLPARMEVAGSRLRISVNDAGASYPVTIDPLNHTPNWEDNGNGLLFPLLNDLTTPVLYGFSVSSAGDLNGDGYGDIVVGAPTYVRILSISGGTFNVAAVGAAFVYLGSSNGPATEPSEVLQPTTQAGALFGFSVSRAGDVNGDGIGDLVVGAPGDHTTLDIGVAPFAVATSVAVGKVYIYYGAAGRFDGNVSASPTVSVTLTLGASDFSSLASVPANPLYGFSVSEAGDVNGDGRGDILVGSPAYIRLLPVPLRAGRVDVYQGSASGIAATPTRSITGTVLDALFGFSVSTAGNVNADRISGRNVSDIIVGAPGDLTFLGVGHAYIFNGSASGITATSNSAANATLGNTGLLNTTLFGYSVSNAGDVNGDGFGDVIVGEPAALDNLLTQTASVGTATIYYGSSGGVTSAGSTTLNSPRRPSILGILQGNLLFGFSVSYAGDLNCDGIDDVVIGEPGGTALSLGSGLLNLVSANVLSGRAYVFLGRVGKPVNSPYYTINQTSTVSAANLIGYSVSDAGDINGDGRADLLVGAPNGTLNLSGSIIPAVGDALRYITVNSIGSSYGYFGCLASPVLPVTLSGFDVQKDGSMAKLLWRTESEIRFSHFEIERSADGQQFAAIGRIAAATGANAGSYRFTDDRPLTGINYYRLKMIDEDGSFAYSRIASLRFDGGFEAKFSIAPNPAAGAFSLCWQAAAGRCEIQLLNAQGLVLQRGSVSASSAGGRHSFERGGLPAGLYYVRVYGQDASLIESLPVLLR